MFAMARDNNLPFAHALAPRAIVVEGPDRAVRRVVGAGRGDPGREHQPAPERDRDALLGRDRLGQPGLPAGDAAAAGRRGCRAADGLGQARRRLTGHGERGRVIFRWAGWGLPVNAVAVAWGLFVVINIGWPAPEILWHRTAGAGSRHRSGTLGLLVAGLLYYVLVQRRRTGILAEHGRGRSARGESDRGRSRRSKARWIGQLAAGE